VIAAIASLGSAARRKLFVLVAILTALVMAAGCGSGGGQGKTGSTTVKRPPGPPPISAKVKAFKLGGEVWAVAAVKGLVWAVAHGEGRVYRIAPSGRRIGRPTRLSRHLGTEANALAVSGGETWLGYSVNSGFVARLDPASGAVGRPVRVGYDVRQLAVGGGAAYGTYLTKIARVPLGGGSPRTVDVRRTPNALLLAGGRLWVTVWNGITGSNGAILELDPRSLSTLGETEARDPYDYSTTSDESEPFGLAEGAGSVWAAVAGDIGEVIRINLRSGRETRIKVGSSYPFAVAFAAGNVWVLDYFDNTITRIDPRTNRVTGRLRVGRPRNSDNIAPRVPAGLAAYGRTLWVTDVDSETLTRVSLGR
jgi:hypothetical protein